jgi:large conductance mechanosensitive channel
MGFIKEFKAFAMRGNVVDLAVGVIIGGAFGKIVNSMIDDLIMPLVGRVIGNADFSDLYVSLNDKVTEAMLAAKAAGGALSLEEARKIGPVFAWGHFLTIVLDFLIMALVIFMFIKAMNRLKKKEEEAPVPAPAPAPAPTKEEVLLTEIRDLLKDKK